MSNFKIEFTFKGINYKADVHKLETAGAMHPAHYQVRNVKPEIPSVPDPYTFTYEVYLQQFYFEPFNHSNELPHKMLSAIKKYSTEHNIPFVL